MLEREEGNGLQLTVNQLTVNCSYLDDFPFIVSVLLLYYLHYGGCLGCDLSPFFSQDGVNGEHITIFRVRPSIEKFFLLLEK